MQRMFTPTRCFEVSAEYLLALVTALDAYNDMAGHIQNESGPLNAV